MKRFKIALCARRWEAAFLLGLALLYTYLALRHSGAYPVVFADEQLYSHFARLVPLADVTIPSYLYLSLYSLTNACGQGFLDCARYLNLLFFIGAAPLVYLATREVAAKPVAMLVALLCVAAPAKTYTAYFMPEAMYFFGFALLTWVALTRTRLHWAAHALATGAVLGLMTLVKVHALFMIPALAVFMLYMAWSGRSAGPWLHIGLAAATLNVLAVIAVKFALGYLFVGDATFQLLGSFYGTQAMDGTGAGTLATLVKLMPAALFSLKGHLMALLLLFALPLAGTLLHALSPAARAAASPRTGALLAYSLLMLGAGLALTVFYTASTAGYGPLDGLRLHARYYNFALILPLMIAAALAGTAIEAPQRRAAPALTWALAAAGAAGIVFAAATLPEAYLLLHVDGPEIVALGIGQPGSWARILLALEIALLAQWARRQGLGALAFLCVFMPLFLLNAERVTNKYVVQSRIASPYDDAGRYANGALSRAERDRLTVAGDNQGELLRARFHIDAPQADSMVLTSGATLATTSMRNRKDWLLVVGRHDQPPGTALVFRHANFTLLKMAPDHRSLGVVRMNQPFGQGLLEGADGLAGPEEWGRWSNADQVRLHFREPLPKKLNLFMTANAFGPNAGKEFTVKVGGAEARFPGPGTRQEVYLQLVTDGRQKTIEIAIPQAVSPKELGFSGDTRRLGMGVTQVEIGSYER